jgi:CubicO group peptidase (beta-lactamase class C family)
MKRWLLYLLSLLGITVVLIAAFFAYVYFRVDDRVVIGEAPAPFRNDKPVMRLDSVLLSPDTLNRHIESLMQKANVQGLAVSIITQNNLAYQQYFGLRNMQKHEPFQAGTIWYGASLSKTVFADVVLQLAEENIIALDTPLVKYLSKPIEHYTTGWLDDLTGQPRIDYRDVAGDPRLGNITARMCLSHTTGLPNWRWLEADRKLKFKGEPGTRYSYSGEGMFLLQFVLEQRTGKSVEQLAAEKIFVPLKMNSSSYVWQRAYETHYAVGHDQHGNNLRIPKPQAPNAAGSLSTSLEDYTIYFSHILKQEPGRYRQLVMPQIAIRSKQQFGPNAWVETTGNDSIRLSYGLGYGVYHTRYGKAFFKEGHLEGWQHYAVGFPERGVALIVLSNSDQAESIFKELIEFTTGNTDTPWLWEGYIPYQATQ